MSTRERDSDSKGLEERKDGIQNKMETRGVEYCGRIQTGTYLVNSLDRMVFPFPFPASSLSHLSNLDILTCVLHVKLV